MNEQLDKGKSFSYWVWGVLFNELFQSFEFLVHDVPKSKAPIIILNQIYRANCGQNEKTNKIQINGKNQSFALLLFLYSQRI